MCLVARLGGELLKAAHQVLGNRTIPLRMRPSEQQLCPNLLDSDSMRCTLFSIRCEQETGQS